MRRTASLLVLVALYLFSGRVGVQADEVCWINPANGELICEDDGVVTDPGSPGSGTPVSSGGMRYLYLGTDPGVGDCFYWSNTPGGLDTWDPANDPAVIGVVTGYPECPVVPGTDPEARAWQIFRSWSLALPAPSLQPEEHGITGLPTFLATNHPEPITHSEVLPDGRTLRVRADVIRLDVSWGDGHDATYAPETAEPYPDGAVTHTYQLKTCTPQYREEHPSGGLCHPDLEFYTITVVFDWGGAYDVGSGWVDLGRLTRSATLTYDVDEARGHPSP